MIYTVRATVDNVTTVIQPGDRFVDDPAFGTVRSVRLTRDGFGNAKIYNTDDWSDVLGLPQTLKITR